MRWLVLSSLRLRVVIVLLALMLSAGWLRSSADIPFDVFPEFAPPLVEIQTEAPGLSTAEVEALITVPLENVLHGLPQLTTLRSKSVLGLSSVVMIFEEGTDVLEARQIVQERAARVAQALPATARSPVVMPPLSSLSRMMKIGLTSKKLSQVELTTLARWTVRPRLMAVSGVANVAIWGQRDRQIQVHVDPQRLQANNVTLDQMLTAARDATAVSAGGFIDMPNQRLAISHVSPVRSAQDLANMPLAHRAGALLRIGDVADVTEGTPPPIGDAVIDTGDGLMLIVEKQPGANTLDVTRGVEAALATLKPALPDVEVNPRIFRPATFIEMSLRNLAWSMLFGALFVIAVLIAFLYEWRSALITIIAMPLSLMAAAWGLTLNGRTIDTMGLAGLIIALGVVVDDAIIDVENIARRLRMNAASETPRSAIEVVLEASLEVRSAVVYGSMIVILVFIPIFMLPGLSGSFFRPLATAYVYAIVASLFVALTVTPALALMLLPGAHQEKDPPLVRWLKARYARMLPAMTEKPRLAVGVLAVTLALTAIAVPLLGEEFLPNFREYDFLMHFVEKPGTSLPAMKRVTVQAAKELRAVPGIHSFGAHIGRAEAADEVVGANFTELWIAMDRDVDYEATIAHVQRIVDGYAGLQRDLLTYLRERVKEVLTGASATIVVRIFGPDLGVLNTQAATVAGALSKVDGVADLKVQAQILVPQIEVRYRPEKAQAVGVSPADVRRAATTLVQGTKVGEIYEDQKLYDVVVWGTPEVRDSVQAVRALGLQTPGGGVVPLESAADVIVAPTPNEITREGGSRRIDVTCNVRGRDLGAVATDIQAALGGVSFPAEYHAELLGEYAAREEGRNRLMTLAAFALLGIFLLLFVDFGGARPALLVFVTLPFALVGGVGAALLSGGVLSLGSLVGFVSVLGIAARNGIMLISHYRHLETEEGMTFGRALILKGAEERLAPILMTALVTALALLPVVLSRHAAGHEIEHPMAVVILGGLATSTLLNLLLLPALYAAYGRAVNPGISERRAPAAARP
jgi:CzcA family heavy metal efflux pump